MILSLFYNSATEFDPDLLDPLLARLRGLLEDFDSEADDVIEELKPLLAGTSRAKAFDAVVAYAEQYDFEQAIVALDEMQSISQARP